MSKEDLTAKEKKTLYGLARFPSFNDRELAEALNEKMSTVTSIRRRLKERGIYFKTMLPNFRALDCEILSVCHGGTTSGYLVDMRKALDKGFFIRDDDPTFLSAVGNFNWLEMAAYRDYSDARRKVETRWTRITELIPGVSENMCVHAYYPLQRIEVHNFFDSTRLLEQLFRMDTKWDRPQPFLRLPGRKLSAIEKLVFYGIVKYPEQPDKTVAEKLSVSRQAVARIRRLLEKEGFVTPLLVPNLDALGYEMTVFFGFRLSARDSRKIRQATVASLLEDIPHLCAISTELECIIVAAYRNFSDYEKSSHKVIRRLEEGGHLEGAPRIQPLLIPTLTMLKNHDYVQMVKNALRLEIDK